MADTETIVWTPETLWATWFRPHEPPEVRDEPARWRDLDVNPAANEGIFAHARDAAEVFVRVAPALLGIEPAFDERGVGQLSRALDRAARDRLMALGAAGDPGGPFFNAMIHAALFVGEVAVRAHGCAWSARNPLWESVVVRRRQRSDGSGVEPLSGVRPFHWLLRHLSDDEIDRNTLSQRFHVHVALALRDLSSLPRLGEPRRLPSLKEPTYDLLVKYLRQHVPLLKDVGAGFPSAREFTERGYRSVGFDLVDGGRVLAIHGQVPAREAMQGAVEVHWLTTEGYDHADLFPCDETPPYFARATADHLEVTLAWEGRPHTHRVDFRGHV